MSASIGSVRSVNPTALDGVSAEQEQDANSALTDLDKGIRNLIFNTTINITVV